MMGDTWLATDMKHYFDSALTHMQEVVDRWDPHTQVGDAPLAAN